MSYPLFHPSSTQPIPLSLAEEEFASAFPAEDSYVERKRGIGDKLVAEAVGFSNSDGGVILIGVEDSGAVAGRPLTPSVEDDLHQRLRLVQPGRYTMHPLVVGSKEITVLAVARRREGFSQTTDGRVLVRRGTMSVALFGEELVRFVNERALSRFETTETSLSAGAASNSEVARIAAAYGWTHDAEQRLNEIGLISERGMLTVGGALHLLDDPAIALGKAYVEVLRFPGEAQEYDKREEVRGCARRQIEDAVGAIMSELGTELVVLGVHRYELPRIPEVVLREALANAVAHRSYELDGTAVRVEIYPDRVTVISPGSLPEPVTVENIRETQAARNNNVIGVLRRLGVAEDAGRGVDVMVDSMRDELLEPPKFASNEHSVTVTLPIRSAVTPVERAWMREIERRGLIEPRDRFLLVHAARGERLTNARAREILSADAIGARSALHRLRDIGFLEQEGARGGASYRLAASLEPPAGLRLSTAELADLLVRDARNPETPRLTNSRVRALTGFDRVEALVLLDQLVSSGRLNRLGERRGTYYVVSDE